MPRTFLDWSRPALPAAATVLVEAHLDTGTTPMADLSDAIVVVPGARAGRRLTELLLAEAEERGIPLLPPRVVTVGALPSLLHTPRHPLAPPPVRRLVWAEALRSFDRTGLEGLFSRLPGADEPLPAWRGLAREVSDLARTVAAGGLTFADVAARCAAGGAPFDDSVRWRVLARVQDDYRRRLDALEVGDPELERLQALDEGRVRLPGPVWLVGVAELPEVVARMLRAGSGAAEGAGVHALVHAPEARGDDFDALGLLRAEVWAQARLPLDDDRVAVVEGPSAQAATVVRLLEAHARGRGTDEVVIGVPQPEVVPFLAQRLGRAGVRVRDAAGTPMSRSGPWRLLAALGDVLRERTQERVAALVRHPDLAPWIRAHMEARPEACLAALDRWSTRHLPGRMVAPYPGVKLAGSAGDDARLVEALMGHLDRELLQELGGSGPLERLMAPALAALRRIYALHTLDESTPTGARTVQALQLLADTAATLAALPPELEIRCDGSAALALLLDESAGARLAAGGDEGAVELLGWLELHLDDTPVAVVTGVNEGTLPETLRGDPFLPDGLRRLLGLEDNRRRLARDLYRLTAMLHSRPVLHLVAGRRTAEGDPLRPSRLLFAADDDTVARRVRRFYGVPGEGGAASPPGAAAPAADGAPPPQGGVRASAFVLPPEPTLRLEPFPTTLSPTDFRGILADPYRWALARLRGPNGAQWPRLEPTDDHAVELDGGAFGDLAHLVLERFGQEELKRHRAGEAVTDPAPLARRLDELVDEVAGARFGHAPRVAVRLQIEQLRLRLRAFADWHAAWVAQGWRMQAAEVTTPPEGIPLESTPAVGIRGKIDRIDHHPERGWAVLDYKTSDRGDDPDTTHLKGGSRGARGAESEWLDLQLPLYHWIAPRLEGLAIAGADPNRISVGYVLLPRDPEATGAALAAWDLETLAAGVATARRLVSELAQGPVVFDENARLRYPDDDRLAALLGRSVLGGDDDDEGEAS